MSTTRKYRPSQRRFDACSDGLRRRQSVDAAIRSRNVPSAVPFDRLETALAPAERQLLLWEMAEVAAADRIVTAEERAMLDALAARLQVPDAYVAAVLGANLARTDVRTPASTPTPTKTCPTCGSDGPPEAAFCSSCGSSLRAGAALAPRQPLTLAADVSLGAEQTPGFGGRVGSAGDIRKLFDETLPAALTKNAEDARTIGAKYQMNITGPTGGEWNIDVSASGPVCKSGIGEADCTISITDKDFEKLVENPQTNGMQLFFEGKLKVTGNPLLAMKLQEALQLPRMRSQQPNASAGIGGRSAETRRGARSTTARLHSTVLRMVHSSQYDNLPGRAVVVAPSLAKTSSSARSTWPFSCTGKVSSDRVGWLGPLWPGGRRPSSSTSRSRRRSHLSSNASFARSRSRSRSASHPFLGARELLLRRLATDHVFRLGAPEFLLRGILRRSGCTRARAGALPLAGASFRHTTSARQWGLLREQAERLGVEGTHFQFVSCSLSARLRRRRGVALTGSSSRGDPLSPSDWSRSFSVVAEDGGVGSTSPLALAIPGTQTFTRAVIRRLRLQRPISS